MAAAIVQNDRFNVSVVTSEITAETQPKLVVANVYALTERKLQGRVSSHGSEFKNNVSTATLHPQPKTYTKCQVITPS